MMQDTTRSRKVLAGLAGVTLSLGIAVSAGAVPRPGDTDVKTVAASSQIEPMPAAARQPGDATPDTTVAPTATTAAPAPTAPATTVAKAAPTTKAPVATTKPTTPTTSAPAAAAPAATATPAATAPATVPRRVPSAAEVQQAIAALPQYVHSIITPTPSEVAQLGNQVCSAFDQGQTFAQVKATGLSMVTQVPRTTVMPGGADWVVRTIVGLYCPGYASKLV
ncbi:MAG TPA: hypothetical protein VHT97_15725 [Acidimicrobiales bacterium]|nr:hypothetical protein [Acidimicrobiales bacterium]